MKNELPCAVVRDLLPSYVEGLTEPETNEAVKAHLAACADCSGRYEAMKMPEREEAGQQEKEVAYLKTIRHRNRNRILLAVAGVLAAVILCAAAFVFVIGEKTNGLYVDIVTDRKAGTLTIQMENGVSATYLVHGKAENHNGIVTISAREVLVSPLAVNRVQPMVLPLDEVKEVWGPRGLLWKNGDVIDWQTHQLWESRIPYVGDASAVGSVRNLLTNLHLLPELPSTFELETEREPYGWVMRYEKELGDWNEKMPRAAFLPLALIENLGQFSWTQPDTEKGTMTLAEANEMLPALTEAYNELHGTDWQPLPSVKDYAKDVYTLQQLLRILGF